MNWEQVLERDGPGAWAVAYRILGNRSDADDCFQETMLSAVKLSRKEPIYNWSALLKRLAAARAIDRLRQKYRINRTQQTGVGLDGIQGSSDPPSAPLEMEELQSQLRLCLSQINTDQAQAFCLCSLEGWSYQEAAEQLGMSAQAVGVLIHRARKRLKELLAGLLESSGGHSKTENRVEEKLP